MTRISIAAASLVLANVCACTSSAPPPVREVPAVCRSPGYPPPPRSPTPAGATELVVALGTVDGGDVTERDGGPSYRSVGLNLDAACTGSVDGPSCLEPPWATANHDDGPNGEDNAFGSLVYSVEPTGLGTKATQLSEQAGNFAWLVRVRDYNGEADDDQVDVALYGATTQGKVSPKTAKWDGADEWKILSPWLESADGDGASVSADAPSVVRDSKAYVSNDVLVARFSRMLGGATTSQDLVEYRSAVLVAKVSHEGLRAFEWATLGARVSLSEALRLFGGYFPRSSGQSPCTTPSAQTYLEIKLELCAYADIRAGDNDRSAPCDGLSQGLAFTGTRASIADTVELVPPSDGICPPGNGTDACDDLH
jgi:hypothetical protein